MSSPSERSCCRSLTSEVRDFASPFGRLISNGWYDGPTHGVVECARCGSLFAFAAIDRGFWADAGNMLVFVLSAVPDRSFAEFEAASTTPLRTPDAHLLLGRDPPLERVVDDMQHSAIRPSAVIAAMDHDLIRRIAVWRPIETLPDLDWFAELGLPRSLR